MFMIAKCNRVQTSCQVCITQCTRYKRLTPSRDILTLPNFVVIQYILGLRIQASSCLTKDSLFLTHKQFVNPPHLSLQLARGLLGALLHHVWRGCPGPVRLLST